MQVASSQQTIYLNMINSRHKVEHSPKFPQIHFHCNWTFPCMRWVIPVHLSYPTPLETRLLNKYLHKGEEFRHIYHSKFSDCSFLWNSIPSWIESFYVSPWPFPIFWAMQDFGGVYSFDGIQS